MEPDGETPACGLALGYGYPWRCVLPAGHFGACEPLDPSSRADEDDGDPDARWDRFVERHPGFGR